MKRSTRRKAAARTAPEPDRHDLYERCAQNPGRDVQLLRAIHAADPKVLGEDFSGTAALSAAWAALSPRHRAVAADHDAQTLSRRRGMPRVTFRHADVMDVSDPADLIAVLNFSIGEIHARRPLVRYFRHALSRLKRHGVLIMDIYAGDDCYNTGMVAQRVKLPDGRAVKYEWEQRHADPLTGRVVNAMHFGYTRRDGRRERLQDAFVYDWRLWSIPELREALAEAGFGSTEVYSRFAEAQDLDGNLYVRPVDDAASELGSSFSAYVVGRK